MQHRCSSIRLLFPCLYTLLAAVPQAQAADIPALTWTQRSDWRNVVTQHNADPTGVNNSTAAIQNALTMLGNGQCAAIYFPPGTYRITSTLVLANTTQYFGGLLIGCGRNSVLKWHGNAGGVMLRADGATHTNYIGLTFDGNSGATAGVDHVTTTGHPQEAFLMYQHCKFMNIRVQDPDGTIAAGIRQGHNNYLATNVCGFKNCYFLNNRTGITFLNANNLENIIEGCEFEGNDYGVYAPWGSTTVRDCHFSRSSTVDIYQGTMANSVRRTTSQGSNRFFWVPGPMTPMLTNILQDCRVDGWTNTTSAVELSASGPTTIFDCAFTTPPNSNPPVRLNNSGSTRQPVLVSNNSSSGTNGVINAGSLGVVTNVGPGSVGVWTTAATQSFLKGTVPAEGTIFDAVTQYSADKTGEVDATAAIQNCINAARNAGNGAVAYIPMGMYKISNTINITGGNYSICGSGYMTIIRWYGGTSGTMISVVDPQQVRLERLFLRAQDNDTTATYDNVCRIRQTSSSGGASDMVYANIWMGGYNLMPNTRTLRGLECDSLPTGAKVRIHHFDGNTNFINCSRATILVNLQTGGRLVVQGAAYPKSGFMGVQYFNGCHNPYDITVRDNQDLILLDYYSENTDRLALIRGDNSTTPGHVTVQATKQGHFAMTSGVIDVNNYTGRVLWNNGGFVDSQHKTNNPGYPIIHSGTRLVDLLFAGNGFRYVQPTITENGSGMTKHLLGNLWRNVDDTVPANYGQITNITNTNTISLVSQGFDDIRRLGILDGNLNYPAPSNSAGTPYITSFSPPSTLRNNHSGWIGMSIRVGSSDITVTDLGRFYVNGNTGTHTVKIVNHATGADVFNGSVQVNMNGGVAGQFKYVSLTTPATLLANGVYDIISLEGADFFYDRASVVTTSAALCDSGVYWNGNLWYLSNGTDNFPYFVTNFKYR